MCCACNCTYIDIRVGAAEDAPKLAAGAATKARFPPEPPQFLMYPLPLVPRGPPLWALGQEHVEHEGDTGAGRGK